MLPNPSFISTLFGKSQSTGDNPFQANCRDGQVATGISMNSGSKLDKINSITCKSIGKIGDSSYAGVKKAINSGGSGGTRYDLECPTNQVIASIYTGYDDLIDYAEVRCADIKTKAAGQKLIYGQMQSFDAKKTVSDPLTGLSGRTGRYIDNLNVQSRNFSSIMQYLESPEGQLACCMGTVPVEYCKFWGTSAGCDSFMNSFCTIPANAERGECSCINSVSQTGIPCPFKFNSKCINSGYTTSNMKTMVCPDFLQCNQINNLSDSAKVLATRLEQNCTTNTTNNIAPIPGTIPNNSGTIPNNSGYTPGTTTYPVASNTSGSSLPAALADNSGSKILLIVLIMFITLAVVLGMYMLFKKKQNGMNKQSNYQNQQNPAPYQNQQNQGYQNQQNPAPYQNQQNQGYQGYQNQQNSAPYQNQQNSNQGYQEYQNQQNYPNSNQGYQNPVPYQNQQNSNQEYQY